MASESPLPAPPNKPDMTECCGRGCYPCILDYYDRALTRWEALVRERGLDPAAILAAAGR